MVDAAMSFRSQSANAVTPSARPGAGRQPLVSILPANDRAAYAADERPGERRKAGIAGHVEGQLPDHFAPVDHSFTFCAERMPVVTRTRCAPPLEYAPRIEGWLTRPCHFAANRRMP